MHISEGMLTIPTLLTGAGVSLAALGIGLRALNNERVPEVAVMASAFFVASLIHVPLGPTSVHLTLNGLIGIVLGVRSTPAIFVALVLQALLFQFGGLTTLGVNTAIMALPALLAGFLCIPLLPRRPAVAGFLAGVIGTAGASVLMAAALVASGQAFENIARAVLMVQAPMVLIEGLVTSSVVVFIARVRPEMLHNPVVARAHERTV